MKITNSYSKYQNLSKFNYSPNFSVIVIIEVREIEELCSGRARYRWVRARTPRNQLPAQREPRPPASGTRPSEQLLSHTILELRLQMRHDGQAMGTENKN